MPESTSIYQGMPYLLLISFLMVS